MIKNIIKDIFDLAFEISTKNNDLNVFIDYMPHVDGIHVRIHKGNMEEDNEQIYNERRYYSNTFNEHELGDFNSVKSYLIDLLNNINTKVVITNE